LTARKSIVIFVAALIAVCALFLAGCGSETPDPFEVAIRAETAGKSISLSWDAVDGADRFRILRKNMEDSDFRFICDVTEGSGYTDEYVDQGIEYAYKVKVYDGAVLIAEGVCDPVGIPLPPCISAVRQIEGKTFEVEWDRADTECVVRGKNASGWLEIGRSNNGLLRFDNTNDCTELSVYAAGEDAEDSEAVTICASCSVLAATALDTWTNAVELGVSNGDWTFEIARSETGDGEYTTVGSAEEKVFYDTKDEESTVPYWYRFRCLGDRFEGAWSEAVQLGTGARDVVYVPVLLYHEFIPEGERSDDAFDEDIITPEEFESDLIWLKENGYTTINTAELAAYLEGRAELPDKPIIISIDDGKYSVYKSGWPLLKKYGMKGSLAVIGSQIDSASADPKAREGSSEVYCTWDEIKEMSDSGAMEIISHTQSMHAYSHNGRHGADCAPGETVEDLLPSASSDARTIMNKIEQLTGSPVTAMAYPFSIRSSVSDRTWLETGYKLLLCGNNDEVHHSKWNPMIREAGLNEYSALLRRIARVGGTPVGRYLRNYEELIAK